MPASELMEGSCPFDVPSGRTVRCGTIEVPAVWGASGPTIVLQVAIFSSISDSAEPDPVVYLEGGPGGDSLETLPLVFERSFAHLLEDRDVIFFDQRGTGYSQPSLACPEVREKGFEMLEQVLTIEEQVSMITDSLQDCRDRLIADGAQLDAYSSVASAADLDALRRALGYEAWNVYGISYGTRLALTTMRTHPQGIRSVVLDSVYSPDDDIFTEAPGNLDRALRELFDGCAEDPACATEYPELEQTFYDTIEGLQANPIRATVTDALNGGVYDAVFDGGAFGSIVFQSLYSAEVIPILPRMIDNVANGEYFELSLLASTFLANGEFVSLGMQFSVQCHEEAVFSSQQETAAALADHPMLEPIFSASINTGAAVFDVCEMWGAGAAEEVENESVISSIPTLVLAGEYDPITPPRWGMEAADLLEASTFLELPGVGHGPSAGNECAQGLMREFLNDPTGALDTSCVESLGGPDFDVGGVEVSNIDMVPFEQSFGTITVSGVYPDGWAQQAPGAWVRAQTGLDQTLLLQQAAPLVPAETLLTLLAGQFGLEDVPAASGTYVSPAVEYTLYEAEISGIPAVFALADTEVGAVLVILAAAPDEFVQMQQMVLIPALDALEVS